MTDDHDGLATPIRARQAVLLSIDPTRRNIRNLIEAQVDRSAVELVVHGPGLAAVRRDAEHAADVAEALGHGVSVAACVNTIRATNISISSSTASPSWPTGIAELVRRQRQGWWYLRP